MTIRIALLAILTLFVAPVIQSVAAETRGDRLALVIGNAKYPDSEAPLKEPINDARDLADELKRDGFDVELGENLSGDAMRRAFDRLYGRVKPGSVVLMFFSGFGIQSGRQSYLIPVDAQIWTEPDVRRDGLSLETILGEIHSRGASIKIALLDASRRNPFERRFRSFSAGLAPIIAPGGSLVMYSAALSSVVSDNGRERSLFVSELLKEIRVPDLTAEETLNRTRVGVTRASRSEQVPWISSSLADDFSFLPGPRSPAAPPPKSTLPAPAQPRQETAEIPAKPEPPAVKLEPAPVKPAPESVKSPPAPVEVAPKIAKPPAVNVEAPAKPPEPPPEPPRVDAMDVAAVGPPEKQEDLLADDPTIKVLTAKLAENPEDAGAYYRRGQVYASKGAYSAALRDFDETIRLNPKDVEAFNNRCWVRAVTNDLQPALRDCNEALRLRPNFVDALDSRGLVSLKNGQPKNAIIDFDAALKINPQLTSSLYGRGLAKLRTGATASGKIDISSAKAMDPNIVKEFESYGVR